MRPSAVRLRGVEVALNGSISTTQPNVFETLRKSSVPSGEAPSLLAFQARETSCRRDRW
jgi:hypothetical protein